MPLKIVIYVVFFGEGYAKSFGLGFSGADKILVSGQAQILAASFHKFNLNQ